MLRIRVADCHLDVLLGLLLRDSQICVGSSHFTLIDSLHFEHARPVIVHRHRYMLVFRLVACKLLELARQLIVARYIALTRSETRDAIIELQFLIILLRLIVFRDPYGLART